MNAKLLHTFLVLERISVAVRVPILIRCLVHPHSCAFLFLVVAPSYSCYRDSANDPQCSLESENTNTLTKTTLPPTLTTTSRRPTNTPDTSNDSSDSNILDDPKSSTTTRLSPTPTGPSASELNGVADWKASLVFSSIAPLFVWIGMWLFG